MIFRSPQGDVDTPTRGRATRGRYNSPSADRPGAVMTRSRFPLALAAMLASTAFAQSPPPAPTVPPHGCVKPDFPGKSAVDAKIRRWSADYKDYTECLKAYVGERNAVIDVNAKAANAAVAEFNSSVKEYNDIVKSMQD